MQTAVFKARGLKPSLEWEPLCVYLIYYLQAPQEAQVEKETS